MRAAAALSACTRTKNHPGQCTAHALLHSAENLDTQRGEEGCIKRAGLVCRAHQYNVAAHRHGRTACVAAHIAMTSTCIDKIPPGTWVCQNIKKKKNSRDGVGSQCNKRRIL